MFFYTMAQDGRIIVAYRFDRQNFYGIGVNLLLKNPHGVHGVSELTTYLYFDP